MPMLCGVGLRGLRVLRPLARPRDVDWLGTIGVTLGGDIGLHVVVILC
jgi:hypothetical protein